MVGATEGGVGGGVVANTGKVEVVGGVGEGADGCFWGGEFKWVCYGALVITRSIHTSSV